MDLVMISIREDGGPLVVYSRLKHILVLLGAVVLFIQALLEDRWLLDVDRVLSDGQGLVVTGAA